MPKQLFTERVQAPFAGVKVTGTDDAPVVEGVLLCGAVSANRRRYLKSAFEGDRVKRYNGKPVKITREHGKANGLYEEEIGTVENARLNANGMPVGDLHINPEKPLGKAFVWDARNKPTACGMSHVAQCESRRAADGWDEVTELVEAVSVDVIGAGHAATTKSLLEHKGSGVALTIKQLCEALVKHPKTTAKQVRPLKALAEMDGMADLSTGMDSAPADDADPKDGITDAFCSACMALVKQGLADPAKAKEVLGKLKEMFASHGKVNGDGTPDKDGDPETGEEEEEMPAKKESKVKTVDPWAVLSECQAAGYTATAAELKALALMTEATDRAAFITDQRKKLAMPEKPKSGQRQPGAGETATKTESKVAVTDRKTFLESIRG